jgi:hypothetical protein
MSAIARDILAYLVEHPHAQDTLEGIVQWWLLEQEIARRTLEVKATLDQLVEQGLVVARRGADERVRYQINRRKAKAISSLLAEQN